jgi:sulfatase modifying factor 1
MNPCRHLAHFLLTLLVSVVPARGQIQNQNSKSDNPTLLSDMVVIPAGTYEPLLRTPQEPAQVAVPAFLLDEQPVTNADYLAFVTANPKWRRSQVSPLFADESYLQHWTGDLEPGPAAPADAPVVRVSWFAARAYARWSGKRLPTTAEWERAAAAGYDQPDGRNDATMKRDLYAWLARPVPAVLADAATLRPDFHGVRGLHGLVWEWVEDFNTATVTGESRADTGLDRDLFCGAGSIGASDTTDYAAFMRAALRSSLQARNTTTSLGFRCARDAAPPIASTP